MPATRRPKATERVADDLRRRIVSRELKEGTLLPAENVFLARYGVSRQTLRAALRVLESEHLIQIQRGARGGVQVLAPSVEVAGSSIGAVMQYRGITIQDLFRARRIYEPACARMLAEHRTDGDLERLAHELETNEKEPDLLGPDTVSSHVDFHALVIELAGHHVLNLFQESVDSVVALACLDLALAQPADARLQRWAAAQQHHRTLFDKIKEQDPDGAERVWRVHLDELADRIAGAGQTIVGGSASVP